MGYSWEQFYSQVRKFWPSTFGKSTDAEILEAFKNDTLNSYKAKHPTEQSLAKQAAEKAAQTAKAAEAVKAATAKTEPAKAAATPAGKAKAPRKPRTPKQPKMRKLEALEGQNQQPLKHEVPVAPKAKSAPKLTKVA